MTLAELHKRLGEILTDSPQHAALPVEFQTTSGRSRTYEPVLFVSGVPLSFPSGDAKVITLIGGGACRRHGPEGPPSL